MPARERSDIVEILAIAGCALSLICVLLRMLARFTSADGQFGTDDWAMIVSMVSRRDLFRYVSTDARLGCGDSILNIGCSV